MSVRRAVEGDIPGFVECYSSIWRSVRGALPEQWLEEVLEDAAVLLP